MTIVVERTVQVRVRILVQTLADRDEALDGLSQWLETVLATRLDRPPAKLLSVEATVEP